MKKVFFATLLTALIAASNYAAYKGGGMVEKSKLELKTYVDLDSTCLLDAVTAQKFLRAKGIEAKVLVFSAKRENGSTVSHAMLLYMSNGHCFLYDKEGSYIIPETVDPSDPIEAVESISKLSIISALYLDV
jgi:hypothetical protein